MNIPVGFCVDLETTIAGRISDTIRPPGQKKVRNSNYRDRRCTLETQPKTV